MPRLPTYQAGQVGLNPASAPMPSGVTGPAVLGQVAQQAGFAMLERLDKRQRQQEALAVERAEIDAETFGSETLRSLSEAAEEGAPGFEEQVAERWTAYKQQALSNAQRLSPEARQLLEMRLDASVGRGLADRAAAFASKARIEKTRTDIGEIITTRANAVMNDPDQYERLAGHVEELIDVFELPAAARREVLSDAKGRIAVAALQGRIDRDPARALADLDGGAWDRLIQPEQKSTLRNGAEAALARRAAEAKQQTTLARVDLRDELRDVEAALRDGRSVPIDTGRIRKTFEADEAQRIIAGLEQASAYGRDAASIRWATPEELNALVESRTAGLETNDVRGYAARAEEAERITRLALQRQQALAEDPAAYVMAAPAVQERVAAVSAAAPEDVPAATRDLVRATLAEQERLGVPEHARRVLSKPQAEALLGRLGTAKPEQAADMLEQMAGEYGGHWPQAYADLTRAGLKPEYRVLATTTSPTGRKELAAAIAQGKEPLKQAAGKDVVRAIDETLTEGMASLYRSLAHAPDGQAQGAAYEDAARLLAYRYAATGDASNAAKRAMADLTGQWDFVETGDGLDTVARTPTGMGNAVAGWAEQVLDGLSADSLADPGEGAAATGGSTPAERQERMLRAVRNGGWINDPAGGGWLRLDELGQPVTLKDGSLLRLRFDQVRVGMTVRR